MEVQPGTNHFQSVDNIAGKDYDGMMYIIDQSVKSDPDRRWNLPDRVFSAVGACHILAYAFIEQYAELGFTPKWIKPIKGYTVNHIVAVNGNVVFYYHGYCEWPALLDHTKRKANRWWPGWNCDLIDLPSDVLVSEMKSRQYAGLWLREPKQFKYDACLGHGVFSTAFHPPEFLCMGIYFMPHAARDFL